MVKHGDKGAKRAKPNNAGKHASANSIPSFDESALNALTERIDKGLGKGKAQEQSPKASKQAKKGGKQDKKTPGSRANGIALGKKRDASGNVIASAGDDKAADTTAKGSSERDILLQEILALGGTEEDLDLLDGVESDEDAIAENASTSKPDSSFAKDLSQFVKSLGIERQVNMDASDSEEEAEEEQDEEESEAEILDEDTEEESDAEPEAPAPKLVQAPVSQKKVEPKANDPNRLVSIRHPSQEST